MRDEGGGSFPPLRELLWPHPRRLSGEAGGRQLSRPPASYIVDHEENEMMRPYKPVWQARRTGTPPTRPYRLPRNGQAGSSLDRCWVVCTTSTSGWPLDLCRYGCGFAAPHFRSLGSRHHAEDPSFAKGKAAMIIAVARQPMTDGRERPGGGPWRFLTKSFPSFPTLRPRAQPGRFRPAVCRWALWVGGERGGGTQC